MAKICIQNGVLSSEDQAVVTAGFESHTKELSAPHYSKEQVNWLAKNEDGRLVGALTADILWDWLYVDELWVDKSMRGEGLGRELMDEAERYATFNSLTGLWLWTQSWQACDFYKHLGYEEFANFSDFPKGHSRIGLRKHL